MTLPAWIEEIERRRVTSHEDSTCASGQGCFFDWCNSDMELRKDFLRLLATVRRYHEALEKIAAKDPKDYEPDCEYWDWDNRGDIYRYGVETERVACSDIAKAALAAGEEGKR
jgi:hypothetical protein